MYGRWRLTDQVFAAAAWTTLRLHEGNEEGATHLEDQPSGLSLHLAYPQRERTILLRTRPYGCREVKDCSARYFTFENYGKIRHHV